jgi:MYND finger
LLTAEVGAIADTVDALDDDSDCPPLALASSFLASDRLSSDDAATAAAILANADSSSSRSSSDSNSSSSSSSSSSSACSNTSVGANTKQQQQQQQPCVQCGQLAKRRCRRCQVVYYCSAECQIQCFPEHRAQCKAGANQQK